MGLLKEPLGYLSTVISSPDRLDLASNDCGRRPGVGTLGEFPRVLVAGDLEAACVSENNSREPGNPGMLVSRMFFRDLDEEFAGIILTDDGSPHPCASAGGLQPGGAIGELLGADPEHLGKFDFGQDHARLSLMRSCRQNAIASSPNKNGTNDG